MFFIPLVHVNQLNKINMKKLKLAIAIILGIYFLAGCLTACSPSARPYSNASNASKGKKASVKSYNPIKKR